MTSFYAKDSAIGLDLCAGTPLSSNNTVDGLDYYKNTMGKAIPDANPNVEPDTTPETDTGTTDAESGGGGGGGGGCFIDTAALDWIIPRSACAVIGRGLGI